MNFFNTAILHAMVLLTIIVMFSGVFLSIINSKDYIDKVMRVLAISTGLLIFLGVNSIYDITYPLIDVYGTVTSKENTPEYFTYPMFLAVEYIIPFILGAYLIFSVILPLKKEKQNNRLVYFSLITSMILILFFTNSYVENMKVHSSNIMFMTGLLLTLLFKVNIIEEIYRQGATDSSEKTNSNEKESNNTKIITFFATFIGVTSIIPIFFENLLYSLPLIISTTLMLLWLVWRGKK